MSVAAARDNEDDDDGMVVVAEENTQHFRSADHVVHNLGSDWMYGCMFTSGRLRVRILYVLPNVFLNQAYTFYI